MVGVHLGAAVTAEGIWWLLDRPESCREFHSVCVIPGTVAEGEDVTHWRVGEKTTWSDSIVERDHATVVPEDEWPDEFCSALALYRMGISEGEES